MEFNPDVLELLDEYKIDRDTGLLCLLAFHFDLSAETTISEEVLKKINLTKIVDKDYESETIKWNIPLFGSSANDPFDWVGDWMEPFGKRNPARKGVKKEVIARMKKWFATNPEYRKEDVFAARDLYFRTQNPDAKVIKTSHKFIKEGAGAESTSMLLMWCEKLKELQSKPNQTANSLAKGTIMK